ncbi:MAG: hypothetical protein NWF07_09555 [Candidatus Bathyarchaeota archaeon]|nr:hypothetical protein [Candidatus Bathyarchaeota archaeon]
MSSRWLGPLRLNKTPIRDYVLKRIRELKAEREELTQEELMARRKEAIEQIERGKKIDKVRRRKMADQIISEHLRVKNLDEYGQLVDNIKRNVVTCLKLQGWKDEDIEVLMRNAKYARVYPETTQDFESLMVDMPKLSDVYIENISSDALESHFDGATVEPEPISVVTPKSQEIELSLSDVYGSWKK